MSDYERQPLGLIDLMNPPHYTRAERFWFWVADHDRGIIVAIYAALLLLLAACDATVTTRVICRGDTTLAVADTSLVKCATLDSLVVSR